MAIPAHLTIKTDGIRFDALLSDWRWLVSSGFAPIMVTAFGDSFLRDESGRIHFLDLMSGEFTRVAESQSEFNRLCEDEERRQRWFADVLLTDVRKLRGDLGDGECYGCKVPLSLGGKLEADNFERTDLEVHYSILGQLHQQTKHLPPGTKIRGINIESPHEDPKPKRWWQRFVG